jgi:hypothetical protein
MACFLCFTSVFGMMDNQSSSPFLSPFSSPDFTSRTTDNNNSSPSFSSSVPSPFLKNDSELIPATTGTNKRGNLAYECSFCKHFLSRMKRRSYQCCICCTSFTVVVKDKKAYLAMSKKSSSKKYRLKNCVCSECNSNWVYFLGKARYCKARCGAVRCICGNCGNGGLCRPYANPATNTRLVKWAALKQCSKRQSARKLVLNKLRNSTK